MAILSPFVTIFDYALQPVAPFTWLGVNISTLDVVAAFRLCLVLRQVREMLQAQHVAINGVKDVEQRSFVKDYATTLTVIYGGEAITSPMLGLPPSFMVSGTIPAFYAAVQAVVDRLPVVPWPSFTTEMPLAVVDGFTRAFLLCSLIPPAVTANASPVISSSPWTLLLTSLVTANAGFFLTNMLSFLHPTPLTLRTPPELQAYGWMTTDLWCAPLTTGLYALLTHAQPFWTDMHTLLVELLGSAAGTLTTLDAAGGKRIVAEPLDPATARALCALVLSGLFTTRTVKNFKGEALSWWRRVKQEPKEKTQ
ncbi:hypothetical protein HGRIS_013664 [Hohenbuehelia grisea]|uniref:Uncharacterized protein n=1 Tax=Hohenbuehelia grisea TaxID=104357 RepID=A0ABR3IWI9_9AGAR